MIFNTHLIDVLTHRGIIATTTETVCQGARQRRTRREYRGIICTIAEKKHVAEKDT